MPNVHKLIMAFNNKTVLNKEIKPAQNPKRCAVAARKISSPPWKHPWQPTETNLDQTQRFKTRYNTSSFSKYIWQLQLKQFNILKTSNKKN